MPYTVLIRSKAERELNRLSPRTYERIVEALLALAEEPRPKGCKKLQGIMEYRLRVGDYRILYTVEDDTQTVEIVSVGHRSDVYR